MLLRTAIACLLFLPAVARLAAGDESYRIRIRNQSEGLVQISLDKGVNWSAAGRVKHPANARIVGFMASSYAPHGTVAATATHGIRIKTGQYSLGVGKAQKTMLFSIEPLQFASKPSGFGGHTSRSSGIYTDIYAGHSIFRNQSPYVGSPVYLEKQHRLAPLPEDYTPAVGDVFVIIVNRPGDQISSVEFQNKKQGSVVAKYANGKQETIACVIKPVLGIGRYDGTTYTGVGAVNTNHSGVLTISNAPVCEPAIQEGGTQETRGGFMIQPAFHAAQQGEQSPQVMIVGPASLASQTPQIEGTAPLFAGSINLTRYENSPQHSFRAEIRVDDGDWQAMPGIVGRFDDAFSPARLSSFLNRKITAGVTAIRLLFPEYDAALLANDLKQEASDYAKRVSGIRKITGTTSIRPEKPAAEKTMLEFYLDGYLVLTSNNNREWQWDTTKSSNGLHEIEIVKDGSSERRIVMLAN